jgi:hypothetical protein
VHGIVWGSVDSHCHGKDIKSQFSIVVGLAARFVTPLRYS